MTEQEAEMFMERLAWVWKPEHIGWNFDSSKNTFCCVARLSEEVSLAYIEPLNNMLCLRRFQNHLLTGQIWCEVKCGSLHWEAPHKWKKDQLLCQEFAKQWHGLFRRNCFLMGIDIEASAHEKAEWMQVFSREEIEAWNLKF